MSHWRERRTWTLVLFASLLSSGLSSFGCGTDEPQSADTSNRPSTDAGERLPVVATYSVLGDWVRRVGGERIELTVLVGPQGDAHTYEPTPQDAVALAKARVIFENGLGFETWLDRLCDASRTPARRCVATRDLRPRSAPGPDGDDELDPHVWHSPRLAMAMVQAIADEFAQLDPLHAAGYRERARLYLDELRQLDRQIRQDVDRLPSERRVLVTTHDTFGYFGDDYGFRVTSVTGAVSTDAADPSARRIAEVVEQIRATGTPAVFSENILGPELTEQVAREAGVKLVRSLYTDALGPPGSPGADYLGMMRSNVRAIVEALQ